MTESSRFDRAPELPDVEPVDPEALRGAIRDGVGFLLDAQNPNGSWGSATRTKGLNIYAPVPGAHHAFRAATTSLCIAALAELQETGGAEVSSTVAIRGQHKLGTWNRAQLAGGCLTWSEAQLAGALFAGSFRQHCAASADPLVHSTIPKRSWAA